MKKLARYRLKVSERKNAMRMRELSAVARSQVRKNDGNFKKLFFKKLICYCGSPGNNDLSTKKASCSSILLAVRFFLARIKVKYYFNSPYNIEGKITEC